MARKKRKSTGFDVLPDEQFHDVISLPNPTAANTAVGGLNAQLNASNNLSNIQADAEFARGRPVLDPNKRQDLGLPSGQLRANEPDATLPPPGIDPISKEYSSQLRDLIMQTGGTLQTAEGPVAIQGQSQQEAPQGFFGAFRDQLTDPNSEANKAKHEALERGGVVGLIRKGYENIGGAIGRGAEAAERALFGPRGADSVVDPVRQLAGPQAGQDPQAPGAAPGTPAVPGAPGAVPAAPDLADNSLFAPDAVLGVGGSFQNDARQQRLAELGGGSARAFENPLDPSNLPTGGGGGRGQIAEKAGGLGKELDRFGSPYGPPTQGLDAALWNQGQGGAVPQGGQYAKGGVTPQEGGVPFAEIDKTQAGALNERALSQTPSGVAARHARSGDGGPIDRMVRYRLADGRMVTAVASNAARYTRDGQGAPGAGQGQGQARSGATGAPAASAGAAGADKQKGGLPAWDAYRESQIAMSEAAGGMKGTRPQLSRSEEQALRLQSPAVGIRKAAERKLEAQRRFDDRATSRAERLYVERQGRYERMADRELLRNEAAEERALKRYGIDQAGAAEIRKGRLADEAASRAGDPVARKRMERVDGLYDSWFNGNTYGEPLSTEARAKRQSRFGALTEAQNRYLKSAMADYIYLQGDNEAMLETLDDHLMGLIEEIEARG